MDLGTLAFAVYLAAQFFALFFVKSPAARETGTQDIPIRWLGWTT